MDDAINFTNKIFYNTPDATLPNTATIAYGANGTTTWLKETPISPQIIDPYINCYGLIKFKANIQGEFRLLFDVDNNGSYLDSVDRFIVGTVTDTANVISYQWDRKNANNTLVSSSQPVKIRIELNERKSEVHFPLLDVESNFDGIKVILNESPGGSTIFWNNSDASLDASSNQTFLSADKKLLK